MAVTSQLVRVSYVGGATNYGVPWMFHYEDALLVMTREIATGVEATKVLGVDYTVTGAHAPTGGEVIFAVAPSAAFQVHIIHDPDLLQRVVLVSGAAIPVVAVERQMDDMVHQNQRTRDLIGRALFLLTDTSGVGVGEGEWDARGNRIINVHDPVDGQDAATKAWVGTQNVVNAVPNPGSLGNGQWNASDPLAVTNVQGLTIAQQQVEVNPLALADSATMLVQIQKLQFQLLALLNWLDAGARGHAYEAIPASTLPAVVAAAAAGAATGANLLVNGSLLVSQREPSESATGTILSGAGQERFPVDRWAVRPVGATVTWNRTTAAGKRANTSKSYIGLELVGNAGMTQVFFATRLSGRKCRALGFGIGAVKNFTFGFKVRHSGTLGTVTPTLRVKSAPNVIDNTSSKFSSGSKTLVGAPVAFAGLTSATEAAYTAVLDLGTTLALANGAEFELEFAPLSANTHKITVSDLWLATSDISSTLQVDNFYDHLEQCKRFYQKTFEYSAKPVTGLSLDGALWAPGAPIGYATHFQFPHSPPLTRWGALSQLTTYNPTNANAMANNGSVDEPVVASFTPEDRVTVIKINPSGGAAQAPWSIHAAVDAEWYD